MTEVGGDGDGAGDFGGLDGGGVVGEEWGGDDGCGDVGLGVGPVLCVRFGFDVFFL
jgi:hypothetical protein